jgi:hypothetical protein
MTKSQLLILLTLLVLVYLYWKNQPTLKLKPTEEKTEIFSSKKEDGLPNFPTEQKDWFTPRHWLSDKELDWALKQIEQEWWEKNSFEPTPPSDPNTIWCPSASYQTQPFFKILEATQFMFCRETLDNDDPSARDSFSVLLSELTGATEELVFIPVNNPDFHWSLLVYEVKEKKFYHFDTLNGANDTYVQPLVKEMLKFLLESWQDPSYHWATEYTISQGNTWDCGVAVLEITKRIIANSSLTELGTFDFKQARKDWRQKLLTNHA